MATKFDPTNRTPKSKYVRQTKRWDIQQIATREIGIGNDDQPDILDAVGTIDDLGGGEILISKHLVIGADINWPRTVIPVGYGEHVSQFKSDGTQRRINITGVPADCPDWAGDAYTVRRLTFDNVSLVFGPNSGDVPRGCKAKSCQFVNSDYGLYFEGQYGGAFAGVGALDCKFRLCETGVWFNKAGPAHFLTHCDISECTDSAIRVHGTVADGMSLFISQVYCDHSKRYFKQTGVLSGDSNVYARGFGVELVGTGDSGAYADGYAIENDGCQIWLRDTNLFAGPDTDALLWNKSGVIYHLSGRVYWNTNQYCRIDAGTIIVDQSKIFMPNKLWGNVLGSVVDVTGNFHHTSSSGGKVVAPRNGFISQALKDGDIPQLTPASNVQNVLIAQAYDYNGIRITFHAKFAAGTTTCTLRVQLADGVHTILCDMAMPVISGGADFVVDYIPGQVFRVSAIFAKFTIPTLGAAAASPPTKAEFDPVVTAVNTGAIWVSHSATESSTVTNDRYLSLTTLGGNPGAATIDFFNFRVVSSGPPQLGI